MQVHIGTPTIRADLRPHRKTCIWLREFLVMDLLNYFLSLQANFLLLNIITNYFTTTVCNFSGGVLTKHILKNISGESSFSKSCSYRNATSLKRDLDTGVFLQVCKQLFYRTTVNKCVLKKLHQICFLVNLMKFPTKIFSQSTSQDTVSLYCKD